MRDWCSGNMFDSNSKDVGSIPTSRAMTFSVKGTRKPSVFEFDTRKGVSTLKGIEIHRFE